MSQDPYNLYGENGALHRAQAAKTGDARVLPHQQAPHAQQAPHETIYIQQAAPTSSGSNVSVTRVTMPVILALSAAIFLMFATYAGTSQFAAIKHSIDKLSTRVEALSAEFKQRISEVETQALADRYTRTDHDRWCLEAERTNSASGWRCPSFRGRETRSSWTSRLLTEKRK